MRKKEAAANKLLSKKFMSVLEAYVQQSLASKMHNS